jgi:hypoxanthine phosphoribosyltransferase
VLISSEDLARRVGELAEEIQNDYAGADRAADDPLVSIGVLTGSVFFLVDLLARIDRLPTRIDFFQTSSYRGGTSPGRDVLLIEDIVDTGYTLRTILDLLRFRGARSVRLCALLDKSSARQVEVPIAYKGFEIDDRFVVGYGLDYNGLYRNLNYIGVYEGEAAEDEE